MYEKIEVKIRQGAEFIVRTLEVSTTAPWEMRLYTEADNVVEYSCKAKDLFECLVLLRVEYLEKKDSFIYCNGARLNVYPSRMTRQMAGGRKAYAMQLGMPARKSDMVDIFEETDESEQIVSVSEQESFMREWIESLE